MTGRLDGATDHTGGQLEPTLDFFADPPDAIGKIESAETTLREGKGPWRWWARALLVLGVGAACATLGCAVGAMARSLGWWAVLTLGGGGLGLLLTALFTGFSGAVTWVGNKGIARIKCSGSRTRVGQPDVFLFADGTALRTRTVRHFTNGAYTGTNYAYNWTDAGGRTRFTIAGTYRNKDGPPAPRDPYHFAVAAERAWSLYLLDAAQRQLDREGYVEFQLARKDWIRVGRGFIELNIGGKQERIDRSDLDNMSIGQGSFTVKRKGGKDGWFFKDGVFRFEYGDMANARLFLLVLSQLADIRFA